MPKMPHVLNSAARGAIKAESGALYEAILNAILRHNPDVAASEARNAAIRLLGPQTVREVFTDEWDLRNLPDAVKVRGRWLPVTRWVYITADQLTEFDFVAHYRSWRKAVAEEFGGLEGFERLKAQYVAEGGSAEDVERYAMAKFWNESPVKW